MKVLITIPYQQKGGVASYLEAIKNHLQMDVIWFRRGSRENSKSSLLKVLSHVWDYVRFFSTMVVHPVDLVLINTSMGPVPLMRDSLFIRLSRLFHRKVLLFIHGWDNEFGNRLSRRKLTGFLQADAIIVLAETFKKTLIEYGFDHAIYNETTAVCDGVAKAVNGNIPSFHKDNQVFTILFLSRVERAKGVFEALQAFRMLKKQYPKVRLNIVGDGRAFEEVEEFLQHHRLEDVSLKGFLVGEDKIGELHQSDVFLFPSYSEGCPISILEAMMFGLPVITSKVGGLPDFFENGRMGFMTDSKEPDVLAQLIEKLMLDEELRREISHYNSQYAKSRFLASHAAGRLEKIMRETVNGKGAD